MRFDPLVPSQVIIVGAVVFAGLVVVRALRGGLTLALARGGLMALSAIAIVADPTTTGGESEARRVSADVVFVVDSTGSMAAIDYDGGAQRLDGVRADILELAAEFPGATFSLVRFDSQARLDLPWTTDLAALETAVSVIRQERAVYSQGTDLDLPLGVLDEMLPRPSAADSSNRERDDSYAIVFYFSDGEQRMRVGDDQPWLNTPDAMVLGENDGAEEPITSFAELAPDVDGGAVFGYGTTAGAPMIEFVGSDELFSPDSPYVVDYETNATAISFLDEDNLVEISAELGVPYIHRSQPGGLGPLASQLAEDAPVVNDGSRETPTRLYWIPALLLLALVMWQATVTATEARATQRLLGRPAPPETRSEPVPATQASTHGRRRRESAA